MPGIHDLTGAHAFFGQTQTYSLRRLSLPGRTVTAKSQRGLVRQRLPTPVESLLANLLSFGFIRRVSLHDNKLRITLRFGSSFGSDYIQNQIANSLNHFDR